jgi:UDP-N-acetylmuramate: L-alanyl-gamma-D-glutamyl-meso-diaminopimelate ligase
MRYYFLGVAGTAMASLAVLLKMKGHQVWGTDQAIYPPMSTFLNEHNIQVNEGYDKRHLLEPLDQVVIGNSLSRGNEEIEEILNHRIPFTSLPKLIHDEFIENHHSIVVTGTHGKTSTTALLSWIFEVAGLSPTFLIGGVAKNFSSSIQLGEGKHFIIEGDEYDHADIYPDLDSIKSEFIKLLKLIPENGLIVANGNDDAVKAVVKSKHSRLQVFGNNIKQEWFYRNVKTNGLKTQFDLIHDGKTIDNFLISQPGEHQVQNAVSATAVARDIGIEWHFIKSALESFTGVKRRLEFWGKLHGALVFDDFAHHPTAVKKTLRVLKQMFPNYRIMALFEPRTNTTVQNFFQKELTQALSLADGVLIAPIHRPERIPSEKRLSIPKIVQGLEEKKVFANALHSCSQIPKLLSEVLREKDVLVLLTNGSLGGYYSIVKDSILPLD